MAEQFTDQNFQEMVLNSEKPVLVDFWAEWCGPCKMIGPVIEELHGEYSDKAVIGKMNVDENSNTPGMYGIRSIPTMLIFKGGQLVDKLVGAVPKSTILEKLERQM
jgi:thioredoxin 1